MPTRKELPRYEAIRARLEEMQSIAPANPCVKGKAECCDRSVGLSRADLTVLLRAVESGQISDDVRAGAYERARDRRSDRCPFLDENRACSIYPFRPLICLPWGIGGRPRPEATEGIIDRKRVQDATGIDQSVAADELVLYACPSCSEEIRRQHPTYPIAAIETITTAYLYLHADDETGVVLQNFVQKNLNAPLHPADRHDRRASGRPNRRPDRGRQR